MFSTQICAPTVLTCRFCADYSQRTHRGTPAAFITGATIKQQMNVKLMTPLSLPPCLLSSFIPSPSPQYVCLVLRAPRPFCAPLPPPFPSFISTVTIPSHMHPHFHFHCPPPPPPSARPSSRAPENHHLSCAFRFQPTQSRPARYSCVSSTRAPGVASGLCALVWGGSRGERDGWARERVMSC